MPTLSVTVTQRHIDGIAGYYKYEESSEDNEGNVIQNKQSVEDFVCEKLIEFIEHRSQRHEEREAIRTAVEGVRENAKTKEKPTVTVEARAVSK